MSKLDQKYLTGLTLRAASGESNAFAELYAATFQEQYRFCCAYLQDTYLAQEALQETYIQALKGIDSLQDPTLFLPFIGYLSYQSCLRIRLQRTTPVPMEEVRVSIGNQDYMLRQLLTLPFTEAEVLLMRYFDHMSIRRIAKLLGIRSTAVSHYRIRAEHRLQAILHP